MALIGYCVPRTWDLKQEAPELTLDMAVRVLRASFARPTLTDKEALDIFDYHLARNRVAHASHRKLWVEKHKRLKKKRLL